MSSVNQIYIRIQEDMEKVEAFEKEKDYDSALTILKDQITFLEGYLTGEVNQETVNNLHSILRDRKILIRVLRITKQVDKLEKATDDRIANLVYKISQIEKELQIKKDGM